MHETSLEQSYLQYFLGYIYYYGKYFSLNKAIIHLEKASNKNKQRQFHRYPYQRGRGQSSENS